MNGLSVYIEKKKRLIEDRLVEFFSDKKRELGNAGSLGEDVTERLLSFSLKGKMIRGSLVFLSYDIFSGIRFNSDTKAEELLLLKNASSSIEVLQSGLLIHDDIMDNDSTRRGEDTFHLYYGKYLYEKRLSLKSGEGEKRDSSDFLTDELVDGGKSLAICAGDIAFFLSFELLADFPVNGEDGFLSDKRFLNRLLRLLSLYSREFSLVGVGQMEDIYLGYSDSLSIERIVNLYRYKTSRYTFSLPMLMGAIIAGEDEPVLSLLGELGEDMGILFQIRDDELGLFGDKEELGKPIGSDIREAKKTIIYFFLAELLKDRKIDVNSNKRLKRILSGIDISDDDISFVREIALNYGIHDRVSGLKSVYRDRIKSRIEKLESLKSISLEYLGILEELVEFIIKRNK